MRLLERHAARDEEQGSLILDVLIGMAIFALLAVIAVTAISQYRLRAYAQSTVSDAKALGLALENAHIDTGNYPAMGLVFPDVSTIGVTMSPKNRVGLYIYENPLLGDTESVYGDTVCITHQAGDDEWTVNAATVYTPEYGGVFGTWSGEPSDIMAACVFAINDGIANGKPDMSGS